MKGGERERERGLINKMEREGERVSGGKRDRSERERERERGRGREREREERRRRE